MSGPWTGILFATTTAIVGIALLSMAVEGWFRIPLKVTERALLGLAAACLIFSNRWAEAVGLLIATAVLWRILARGRRLDAAAAAPSNAPVMR